ncbi:uncharacterized protein LOC136759381 isoform X2 [Amia ocellicauda]|uniref:uncharacterized protein LOC136759381 isoform X2 n=1 Tax=Amia ocellicauda TaxID=2972642 RepID=UPI0034643602
MPTDSPNRTRSGDEVNLTQGEPQHQPWTALPRGHRNGSTVPPRPALTGLPADKDSQAPGSGIIPGAIAAALFITFLLALYTVLWKCMVSAPLRCLCKL